ncbi:MAG TPA: hypothetical protein VGL77_08630 [Armatimonadota bacterium]
MTMTDRLLLAYANESDGVDAAGEATALFNDGTTTDHGVTRHLQVWKRWPGGVYLVQSADRGDHWSTPVNILKNGRRLAIALGTDCVYAAGVAKVPWVAHGQELPPMMPPGLRWGWRDDAVDDSEKKATWLPVQGQLIWSKVPLKDPLQASARVLEQETNITEVSLVSDGDKAVYLVYTRGNADREALWLRRSSDGGNAWSVPEQLTNETMLDREPCLTLFRNALCVAYAHSDRGKASVINYLRLPLDRWAVSEQPIK